MWSSAGASVGVVTESMDVHATLGVGIVSADFISDGGWAALRILLESDGSLDVGVSTEDCDCIVASMLALLCS